MSGPIIVHNQVPNVYDIKCNVDNHFENWAKLFLIDFCSISCYVALRFYGLFEKAMSLMSICTLRRQNRATVSSRATRLFENKYKEAISYHQI